MSKAGVLDLIDLKLDYIEDWSSGECVNNEHGVNDCLTDRYQLCAAHMVPQSEWWPFVHCNYQYQSCLLATTSPGGQYPTCYLEGVMEGCAAYTSTSFGDLKACASNSTSAGWAKVSGAATAKGAGGHPLWVIVDGTEVTDTSSGTDAWASAVLLSICTAAKGAGQDLPDACASNQPVSLKILRG